MTYDIRCYGCGSTATAETVGAVLDLPEEHRFETGEDHLFEFTLVGR